MHMKKKRLIIHDLCHVISRICNLTVCLIITGVCSLISNTYASTCACHKQWIDVRIAHDSVSMDQRGLDNFCDFLVF